jgi:hypothetical protein
MDVPAQLKNWTRLRGVVIRADRAAIAAVLASIVLMPAQLIDSQGLRILMLIGLFGVYSFYFRKPIDPSRPLPWLGWIIGVSSLLWIVGFAALLAWVGVRATLYR